MKPVTRRAAIVTLLGSTVGSSIALAQSGRAAPSERMIMQIAIDVSGTRLTASLFDNPSARDFASMLPLDLALEHYAANEKIGYLPRKLTTDGSGPFGGEAIGDIAYYAPWGNLAFFYGGYRYSRGLIRLGRLDGDIAPLLRDGRFTVRIERLP
ncbi:cyclophilin-like fold protein [Mesorhizobium sp. M0060]|uniref:cyclophilin-like fold protein n=1 Tax=Mesorhizobium sp. M0060 TaxID=2956866 RepID=UPI00333C483C